MRRLILLLLLCLSLAASGAPVRVLFIGNSYTSQIRNTLVTLLTAPPHEDTELEFITPGGRTLAQHFATPATLERIRTGKWNFVVLQDQSQTPAVFPDQFATASAKLHKVIQESGATTLYYETWGRRDGDSQNAKRFPDYLSMQAALSSSYSKAAQRDRSPLVPVGTAWKSIRASDPELGRVLYKPDASHPSDRGAFLAACCFHQAIHHQLPDSVLGLSKIPKEEAAKLLSAAQKAGASKP